MAADKYWDIKRTLSHNCLFNFIVGCRGAGKTYGALKFCIEKYLKERAVGNVWQFVYVRRYKTELEKLTTCRNGRIFRAVQKEFPEYSLKAESNVMYIKGKGIPEWEVIGYAVPLTVAKIYKSDSFPDVKMLVFDEFIIENRGSYHYLKDEVGAFLDFYETVGRPGTDHEDVVAFFLSNAISISNPYFEYFGLCRPYDSEFKKFGNDKDILVQDVKSELLQDDKHASRFGRLIAGSAYASYAIDNEWLLDNNDFIEKKNSRCQYRMSIRYKDTWLGVWFDDLQCVYFVSGDVDLQYPVKFSATTDDHQPNMMLIRSAKRLNNLGHLIEAYNVGAVRYENVKIKNNFREIMRMINYG